ncbi:hypothetical protein L596_022959 [Steinernema carpocapsae]|uniref:Uncharacterized protein n=1 Tax=Steinernema carpocapsae TaxID=34508 RepID=A0A4U5MC51_STECR|nr:hypothetical protein L596_022959 [Steinernema carpocapsae]
MRFSRALLWLLRAILYTFGSAILISFRATTTICHESARIVVNETKIPVFHCESKGGFFPAGGRLTLVLLCCLATSAFQSLESYGTFVGNWERHNRRRCALGSLSCALATILALALANVSKWWIGASTVAFWAQFVLILIMYPEDDEAEKAKDFRGEKDDEDDNLKDALFPTIAFQQNWNEATQELTPPEDSFAPLHRSSSPKFTRINMP